MVEYKKAAVIGHPIKHSLSPVIHNYWLVKYGIDGEYGRLDVPPDDLEKFLREDIFEQGYSGVNITIPHKENAYNLMHEIEDDITNYLGVVNTVTVRDGKLSGSNTDYHGFLHNILSGNKGYDLSGKKALVIGAGGASRAVILALLIGLKAENVVIVNRTKEKSENVRDFLKRRCSEASKIKIEDWENRNNVIADADLLVNTTSLGMAGQPDLEIDLSLLPLSSIVTDIVYSPLETELLRKARERGNPVIDGLGMLLHQAAPGFEKWFGVYPEVTEELRSRVINSMYNKDCDCKPANSLA